MSPPSNVVQLESTAVTSAVDHEIPLFSSWLASAGMLPAFEMMIDDECCGTITQQRHTVLAQLRQAIDLLLECHLPNIR